MYSRQWASRLSTITLEFVERPLPGLSWTDPFLQFVGMEEEGEAQGIAHFGGSSLCHLMTWGHPRGTKRTREKMIFCWDDDLFGELLYGSSLTLFTAASSCAGSLALCLDRPIMGKAQHYGDQVYTHTPN
jgi:hypothetical protein